MSEKKYIIKRTPKPPDFVPEPVFPEGHPRAGKPRCQAWSSRLGRQCSQPPVPGKRVCRFHGGASPRGVKSGAYKHGRYSKSLAEASKKLATDYETALREAERLLDLSDEIALVIAQIQDAIKGGEVITTKDFARKMLELHQNALTAIRKNDPVMLNKIIVDWGAYSQAALGKAIDWEVVNNRIETHRKLVETQQKWILTSEKSMPVEQVMLIIGTIISHFQDAITHNVRDSELADKIITIAAQKTDASLSAHT